MKPANSSRSSPILSDRLRQLIRIAMALDLPRFARVTMSLFFSTMGAGFAAQSSLPGTLDVRLYAMDAATFAKAPDALLADPAKMLDFLTRRGSAGMVYQILAEESPVRDGTVKLEKDVKVWKYATEYNWEGNSAVPTGYRNRMCGITLNVTISEQEAGGIRLSNNFNWALAPDHPPAQGRTQEISMPVWRTIVAKAEAIVHRGKPALAALWRSDIPPPGCKESGPWQYLLFYTLR